VRAELTYLPGPVSKKKSLACRVMALDNANKWTRSVAK
jgi:hypothetical protein